MNRHNFLSTITKARNAEVVKSPLVPPPNTLNPYQGPWTIKQASHLMRRTMFGPNQSQIGQCLSMGLDGTLDSLFANCVPSPPPVIYTLPEEPVNGSGLFPVFVDPFVDYGDTWVNEPVIYDAGDVTLNNLIRKHRRNSILAWPFINMMKPELNIMPKLWLFWHNHFVVADFTFPNTYYEYSKVIEDHAKGNFRDLTKDMTVDIGMLLYLNGNRNSKEAPNENYARELLELFTVGKGEAVGPGDYSTFTEQDVQSMARVLTGWGLNFYDNGSRVESFFRAERHDAGDKILSHRFNNEVISDGGEDEYKNLIDIIFQQDAVAKFISRKFYRYFVNHELTSDVETNIIEPMAQIIMEDDYNIERALKALLSSEHFFGEEVVGCMIKNPADFIIGATRGLNFEFKDEPYNDYYMSAIWRVYHGELDMGIYFHPTVAGWKAYYQAPQYYRNWINTYYLPKRNQLTASIAGGGLVPFLGGELQVPQLINVIQYISNIENADDPNDLIYSIANLIFSSPISEAQKDFLKQIIIPGLPDFEWTVEYTDFLSDPTNEAKRDAINNKLVALFRAMLEMPEYQLM